MNRSTYLGIIIKDFKSRIAKAQGIFLPRSSKKVWKNKKKGLKTKIRLFEAPLMTV